jgi:hypothetical protein
MALGTQQTQQRFENPRDLLGDRLKQGSIYRLLADHGHVMFPDDYFADLYSDSVKGRPTVPARVLATVMLLQAFEGLSDREACDRLGFDLRWQAAAGVDTAAEAFHATVLPGQRNRLRHRFARDGSSRTPRWWPPPPVLQGVAARNGPHVNDREPLHIWTPTGFQCRRCQRCGAGEGSGVRVTGWLATAGGVVSGDGWRAGADGSVVTRLREVAGRLERFSRRRGHGIGARGWGEG